MSTSGPGKVIDGRKLVFSLDDLPAHLDARTRLDILRDLFTARVGPCELASTSDLPLSARCEFTPFGNIAVTRFATTVQRYERTSKHVAADSREYLLIGFNRGQRQQTLCQRGRELVLDPGQLAIYISTEPHTARAKSDMHVVGLRLPRRLLLERVAHADDLALLPIAPNGAAVRHLRRYLDFLLEPAGFGNDPSLIAHLEGTLLDLAALALGAIGETVEIARGRGLRAARLREVVAEIKVGFCDPALSADAVGARLGLAGRYVQNLLSESGVSFTERVLELRLQMARAMLADPRHDRLKVSDIALSCGFNEVSYFNRCFRRRFDDSPTGYRDGEPD